MPQALCHMFVFFLYNLTMLRTFPSDITWVSESTLFTLSPFYPPLLLLLQIIVRLIFNQSLGFYAASNLEWLALRRPHEPVEQPCVTVALAVSVYGRIECLGSSSGVCVRQTTRLLWSYK